MVRALVLAVIVGLTGIASAQQTAKSTALFEEGRALAKDGKWEEACTKFAASLELDPAIGTQLNYADCHEHLGHLAQAWRLFDAAALASDKEGNADRAKFARQRADTLLLKVGTVVVKVATPSTPGLTLSIAGRATKPAAEIRDIVDPGEVVVEATAPNLAPVRQTARAEAGKTIVIEIPALAETPREPLTTTERRRSRVLVSYTLAGVGGASLVTGIVVGILARSRYQQQIDNMNCTTESPPRCNADGFNAQNSAITLANVGTVLGAGGLLLIAGGAVVFLTAPHDIVVSPTASAQSAGLAVVGRF